MRTLALFLLSLLCVSCGNSADSDRRSDRQRTDERSRETFLKNASTGNPELVARVKQLANESRRDVPQRTADGNMTLVDVRARGTSLIFYVDAAVDMTNSLFPDFERVLRRGICDDEESRSMAAEGIGQVYVLRDSEGEEFVTQSVMSCPTA